MFKNEWRIEIGILIGLVFGVVLWIYSFDPNAGLFQNPQLIITPAAIGVFIVNQRNKWRGLGYYSKKNPLKDTKNIIRKQMELEIGTIINGRNFKKNKFHVKKRINKYKSGS